MMTISYKSESDHISILSKEISKYEMFSLAKDDTDILKRWKNHQSILPNLAELAKSVLTIPCSSAKSERVFSCAGNIATKKKNRLLTAKLEDLVILKQNRESLKNFKSEHENSKKEGDIFQKITIQTENDEVDGLELVLEASIDMSVDDDHVDYDDDDNDDNDDS